ncbi:hypothetical protein C8F04DRAFT_1090744 [Mycena alexandri]|uniref:Uncharacterized protein n=1 Tax=Mycena alexandri TaxID=1745969 RepID=A0AAD6T600_9AGAR|nr:hypothetical protein C8F04DRAFT_1090744 [Mycena alexandri]
MIARYLSCQIQMIWETPFSTTDPTFPCSLDRISGPLEDVDHMYIHDQPLAEQEHRPHRCRCDC